MKWSALRIGRAAPELIRWGAAANLFGKCNEINRFDIRFGTQRIMFADIIEFDLSKGTSVFLTITFEAAASVKRAYEVLKEGSTIVYPMVSTTYSSCFVSLIDKFRIRWALMTEQTDK